MPNSTDTTSHTITEQLQIIASWVILSFISIIISGKFLNQVLEFSDESKHFLKINLIAFSIEAKNNEVIFGLTTLIFTFISVVSFVEATLIDQITKVRFGINVNHFEAVFFLSSLASLVLAFVLMIFLKLLQIIRGKKLHKSSVHDKALEKASNLTEAREKDEHN